MRTDKPILTISIAAKLLGVHPRTLMLYERAGLITPHRTGTKRRLFSTTNLDELQFIKYLTREEGLNLVGVKIIQEAIQVGENHNIKLKKLLFPTFKLKALL